MRLGYSINVIIYNIWHLYYDEISKEVFVLIKATKIIMQSGKEKSNLVTEIESIYLTGVEKEGFYTKERIYDFLKKDSKNEIKVNISPYPKLIPVLREQQKYVRSEANDTPNDNLLKLPRE